MRGPGWLVALLLLVVALLLLFGSSGCAASIWLGRPLQIDEYASARVRVYASGDDCRVEVMTATLTVVTLPTRCLTVQHATRP